MEERYLVGLAAILVVGLAARWVAWKLHLPSILLLLVCGIIAGPVTGWLHPDELFGPALMPLVSLSVGVILFEGGLSLNIREVRRIGGVVTRLVTVGVLVTWVLAAAAAYLILRLDPAMSVLLGAILVVSGPTVVIPLIEHVRPKGQISTVIRWEGILNDPVGALLAVVIYELILAGGQPEGAGEQFLLSIGLGALVGVVGAAILIVLFRYYLLPDYLQNPFSLSLVVAVFTVSNHFQPESGLLATTLMGIVLANQKFVIVRHIVEFKENLRVLVISSLFILLAARLTVDDMEKIGWPALAFLATLIVVVRPAAVWASAVGSKLTSQERDFVSWMAPRGIVAAAVSSVFADRLVEAGIPNADLLVPIVFLVIVGTVSLYGLTAFAVARRLELAEPEPKGVLFVGAHSWAREMAEALKKEGFQVALADSNWNEVAKASLKGLTVYYGGILSEHVLDRVNLYGIGRLLAMTSNEEANSLASLHFASIFGRKEVYQLRPYSPGKEATRRQISPLHLSGRVLFGEHVTHDLLSKRFAEGSKLTRSRLTDQFNWKAWQAEYGEEALLLFIIRTNKEGDSDVIIAAADRKLKPRSGDIVIGLTSGKPREKSREDQPEAGGVPDKPSAEVKIE